MGVITIILIIALVSLGGLNLYMMYYYYQKYYIVPSAAYAMKSISRVYDILTLITNTTKAHKATIGKTCYKCDQPYFELLYDNVIPDEERYNVKYNRMSMDDHLVDKLKSVAKGAIVLSRYDELPDGTQKVIYKHEGVGYSEIHKLIMVDQFLYILILHYKDESDKINDEALTKYKNKLISIFKRNKSNL